MSDLTPALADRSLIAADLTETAARAADYARAARAENTRRAYAAGWRSFATWCEARGLAALPADPGTLGLYLADAAGQGAKVASLRVRLAAVVAAHRLAGHALDTRAREIREVWAGIRRTHGQPPAQKAPATCGVMRGLVAAAGADLRGLRDRALVLIGFAAALRRSELVALDVAAVQVVPEGLVLRLARSKTDQEAAGAELAIPYGRSPETCPVRALAAWLAAAGIAEGAVFRSILKAGRVTDRRLSDRDVARIVKRLAEAAGHDPARFAGHSLRAGFATSAAEAGASEAAIQRQTRHKSLNVLRGYIRRGSLFQDHAGAVLGL